MFTLYCKVKSDNTEVLLRDTKEGAGTYLAQTQRI